MSREGCSRASIGADMRDPEIKNVLLDLAEAWRQLAAKIDAANKIAGDLLKGRVTYPLK
jgi:hypothetical protein